jgi:hypothetical protein
MFEFQKKQRPSESRPGVFWGEAAYLIKSESPSGNALV